MESIKALSEEAYEYLVEIGPQHWSRHRFRTNCKSNMLLNNMCETFNSVLKKARDKPVLTMMEWMRRYLMKRTYEKWVGVQSYKGKNMPYIGKTFVGMEDESRECILQISREDLYEVRHRGDQLKVDLAAQTCTCYHWQLTGIPCVHAYRCILNKNVNPHEYVHEAYSRETFLKAYSATINPMPGANHWSKTDLPQPLPHVYKVMSGRPSKKKRKKERGEDAEKGKSKKGKCKCSNCGQVDHNKKGCKAPKTTASPKQSGRPESNNNWAASERTKKAQRAKTKVGTSSVQQPSTSTQHNSKASTKAKPPQPPTTKKSTAQSRTQTEGRVQTQAPAPKSSSTPTPSSTAPQ